MSKYDIWVDFNEIKLNDLGVDGHPCDSHNHTLLAYCPRPDRVVRGARLLAGDDDGNTCDCTILDSMTMTANNRPVQDVICVQLHAETFKGARE